MLVEFLSIILNFK